MNRTVTILLTGLLVATCAAFFLWPRGHRSLVVTDVSRPFSASVSSPIRPLGSGALYVIMEGRLDGEGVLEVISNGGRDRREVPLRGPKILFVTGSAEEWVDDLQVRYHPTTAKSGQLYVSLYCGTEFTPNDLERYDSISAHR